ncbi:hydrogen gas-evolving membrane-bound hydrogenase subunit E [Halanaerobacter jeridensis]|uniref:Multicomponent Na+:H+ antiporter subunit B n=1 Tax=Halanaerobacter jeridensis TaxID=706427 RepID=A0A938XP92_9FIRM|nr:hydrogen gas-evolving membrane-bound hydrogenase subunit E [Halanaerobacter jeridensis]MBM7556648.1 multicomponent Na+:H+ antiporter subunit B [Halanaerobacter jeridensis]
MTFKKVYSLGLIFLLGILLVVTFMNFNQNNFNNNYDLSEYYINQGVQDTKSINLVTAILFDYRGFDTLGEATVIFIAALIISLLTKRSTSSLVYNNFSPLVYQNISFIVPFLYIFGFYLIFYGHLSPGGGFAGGVVIATIFVLLTITFGVRRTREEDVLRAKSLLENLGMAGFVIIGLLGMVSGYNFLANGQAGFYLGEAGKLISAGTIPWLNLMTGIKVGASLSIIFNCLVREVE